MQDFSARINARITRKAESIIYLLIWLVVITVPVFTMQSIDGGTDWTRIFVSWVRLTPVILIFFINNYVLSPNLLMKKKLLFYLIALALLIIIITQLSPNLRVVVEWITQYAQSPLQGPRHIKPKSELLTERFVMSILVVGMNNTIKLLIRRHEEEKQLEVQNKLLLQTELSFLRNQIGPHFFMNTLNNIHALIALDPDKAGKSVIQLSELMRHLLRESKTERATIQDEFSFLNSYINLMKLRCSKRVNIEVSLNMAQGERYIPSFLFVSLVENAFKYGVDYSEPSFILIHAGVLENSLWFRCSNSKNRQVPDEQKTGIGLANLRKQLDLLYKNRYSLEILDESHQFSVNLKIPLDHD